MTIIVKILNDLWVQDYELSQRTGQCHLTKDQWKWVISEIIREYKERTIEIEYESKINK